MEQRFKVAVRTFERLNDIMMKELSIAEECDAGFDGGEWSRGFHGRIQDEAKSDLIIRVAKRFNLSPMRLEDAIFKYENAQLDHLYSRNSKIIRSPSV